MPSNQNKIRYDFSNPESQKLFEEFTILITELTLEIQLLNQKISELEDKQNKKVHFSLRTKTKKILKKLSQYV